MEKYREHYRLEILLRTYGWIWFTLFLFIVFSTWLFNLSTFKGLEISAKKEIMDYIIRFMIFEIPAIITIFTFVYKEKKEASYSNIKTSNILKFFIWTISFSAMTLFFAIFTIYENPVENNVIDNFHHFLITLSYSIISLILLILYLSSLLRNMDARYSFKKTFSQTTDLHNFLKYIYKLEKSALFKYQHLMLKYNHLIEADFQLLTFSISRKNISDIEKELERVFILTKDFHQNFIDVESFKKLGRFFELTDNDFLLSRVLLKMLGYKKYSKTFIPINNKENLLEIYKNILMNYKMLIRESSHNGLTNIQKQAFKEFMMLNPVKVYIQLEEDISDSTFNIILAYYEELTKHFHTSLFEIVKEFSDENTVEYSYILENITDTTEFFDDITLISDGTNEKHRRLYNSFVVKVLSLVEVLIIWSIETNNVRFLTESTNMLLQFYYTHIEYKDFSSALLRKRLRGRKEENLLEQFINQNKDLTSKNIESIKGYHFRRFTVNRIIEIIILALHKSIELGHYSCTGYLAKISVSHLKIVNFLDSIISYANTLIDRNTISYHFGYYHYTINNFSKIHCLQKMTVLLEFQILYKYGKSANDEKLEEVLRHIFLDNKKDLTYMIVKIKEAKYGMISINDQIEEIITNYLPD